jgi:hypothetical protein
MTVPTLPPEEPIQQWTILPDLPLPSSLDDIPDSADGYFVWGQTVHYHRDYGSRMIPTAAEAISEQGVVRVHGGACIKEISGFCVRADLMPQVSSSDTQSANEILLADDLILFSPMKLPDGTNLFAVAWYYLYGLRQMPSATDRLDFCASVFTLQPASVYTIDPTQFVRSLVGPAASVTGAPQSKLTGFLIGSGT